MSCCVTEVVECLPSKSKALNSNSGTTAKKEKQKKAPPISKLDKEKKFQ
jgi:hypothetical protein